MAILTTQCAYVEKGYGQVEPNHLSAQRTGQIYAQLPVEAGRGILENGQFVKYDYRNKEVNLTGEGEWMLVYNEVKVYRDYQGDKDFAMLADNYGALVYSAHDGVPTANPNTVDWTSAITAADPYEVDSTDAPMQDKVFGGPELMHEAYTYSKIPGTQVDAFVTGRTGAKVMVPRVLKTNVGDIFTTNTIANETVAATDTLAVDPATGILTVVDSEFTPASNNTMRWQVVKLYTMPDGQKGVKIMRIA